MIVSPETPETQPESHRETKNKPNLSIRIPDDWMQQILEISQKTGRTKTDVANEAIARYLGKEYKFVVDELHQAVANITELRKQNQTLLNQNRYLYKRLQRIEGLFKSMATG